MVSMYRFATCIGLFISIVFSQVTHYSENFEGTVNWTVSGGWEFGTPTNVGPTNVPEGSRCAGTVLNGDYANNVNYTLVSSEFFLPDSSVILLSFYEWDSLESCCDHIYFYVENINTNTITQLSALNSAVSESWNQRLYDVSAYKNSAIRVQFKLTTDHSVVNPGWYIDQFQIFTPEYKILSILNSEKGNTYPSGKLNLWSNTDTLITAIPNGGYQFSSWSVIEGNATFSSAYSASTQVQVQSDSAVIQPNFVINPNTRPNIEISDINLSSHPDICLTVAVTDTAGRSISGLDSSHFTLAQDNSNVNYQLTQISEVAGVSVALVIDRSGSMSSAMMTDAKEAAKQYVRTMGPLDRSAIVSFESSARLDQATTGDTTLLISAIGGINASGGTSILNGTLMGIGQLLNETNTRALIIFSDGQNSDTRLNAVIDSAKHSNITIYSIGIGASAGNQMLSALADSTGGYFTTAPTAANLAQIYAQIKSDIQAQYVLCYHTPDEIFNGDTHRVVVSVNLNNNTDLDTVYWDENNRPPVIALTTETQSMIGVNQLSNQPVTISANITDDGTISSARLFYRTSNIAAVSYTEMPMVHISGSVYQAIIPNANVRYPGIDFYILATDNYQMIGRSPNILAPETQPWVIPVDNRVPVISNPQTTCLTPGINNTISANINDSDGVFYAILYFKKSTETFFTIDTMTETSPDQYTATIPSGIISADGIDYYIRAVDDVGASARYPAFGNNNLILCQNQNRPPVANAGADQTIFTGNTCSASVSLTGSSSSDPDGDPLTYKWIVPPAAAYSGVNLSTSLSLGVHHIYLVVSDNQSASDTDIVVITIRDTAPPVPIQNTLPDLRGSCSFTYSGKHPLAIDNCSDTVSAITYDTLTYTEQDTFEIEWIYADSNGNSISQKQRVIIDDTDPPTPNVAILDTLRSECSIIISTQPTAFDNCSGPIRGVTISPDTISDSGVHQITWTYTDTNGNISSQTQIAIIRDTTPPSITVPNDTTLILRAADSTVFLHFDSASASDNCSYLSITASRNDKLPLNSAYKKGITKVLWIATDGSGNSDTAIQVITVKINHAPVLIAPVDTFMAERQPVSLIATASDSDGIKPVISFLSPPVWLVSKNQNDTVQISLSPGCTDSGTYLIRLFATDSIDTTFSEFKVRVDPVNFPPVFDPLPLQMKLSENIPFELKVNIEDCDGTIPSIRMLTNIPGATFTDNLNSTGTFKWTPDADDYGFYMVIFETTDNNTIVRDTIIFEVEDKNVSPPVLTVSATDTTSSINLPIIIIAKATDPDGTVPVLKATQLPEGATFSTENANGNGVFSWVPHDTGTVSFFITAYDQFDPTMFDSQCVIIRVNNKNITGPEFEPHPPITIEQNNKLILTIRAVDPDGTVPALKILSAPDDALFKDNGDGTGQISWTPQCNISGSFLVKAAASDGQFSDTITIPIDVIDINCPPVLYSIADINAQFGQRISIPVLAYDPDDNGTTPVLSVMCQLPGFTFITKSDGSAQFNWTVSYQSGSYPVKFYATDGNQTDSTIVILSINKKGTLKLSVSPSNSKIFTFATGNYQGKFLGNDSITFTNTPGAYTFEFQAPGYRSQRITCNIKADSTINIHYDLKHVLPLMLLSADTIIRGSSKIAPEDGSFSFADFNGDHIIDLSLTTLSGITCYYGIDSSDQSVFNSFPVTCYSKSLPKIIHHSFVHWNNNHSLNCIASTNKGNILRIDLNSNTIDTLLSVNGAYLYHTVFDLNKDGKKDIIVNHAGVGLFLYYNSGTDSMPLIDFAKECTNANGASFSDMTGAPLLIDLDADNREEVLAFSGGILKVFKPDSSFSTLSFVENLSCGGVQLKADTASNSLIGSSTGISKLAMRIKNHILIYQTHLQGDVTLDGKVDIRDISKISGNWELTEHDQSWEPVLNLKVSESGLERIDIRDINRASKNWELEE